MKCRLLLNVVRPSSSFIVVDWRRWRLSCLPWALAVSTGGVCSRQGGVTVAIRERSEVPFPSKTHMLQGTPLLIDHELVDVALATDHEVAIMAFSWLSQAVEKKKG